MSKTHYEAFIGSRCYGLNLPGSDKDLFRVSDSWDIRMLDDNLHQIQIPAEEFINRALIQDTNPLYLQVLFPAEVTVPGVIWPWIEENREKVISADLPRVWRMFYKTACGQLVCREKLYNFYPKRLVYCALELSTLVRYAAGETFADAYRPEEELREQLMAMRLGQMSYEEAMALCQSLKAGAEAAADFYSRNRDDDWMENAVKELKAIISQEEE